MKRTKKGVEYSWVLDKNYTAFWQQYKYLIARFYSYYYHLLNKYNLSNEFADLNDFYCASWLVVKKAIDALKPEKISDKDKWWGYIQISFYLRNWVNRDLVIRRLKERHLVNVLVKENVINENFETESTEQ